MMRKLIFFAYLALITILSLMPSNDLPSVKLFSGADKIIHFLMYTGFSFLLMWAWPNFFRGNLVLLPLFAVMFYGLGLEILQDLGHEGRAFEIYDILANTLGYFPGLALFYIVRKREDH